MCGCGIWPQLVFLRGEHKTHGNLRHPMCSSRPLWCLSSCSGLGAQCRGLCCASRRLPAHLGSAGGWRGTVLLPTPFPSSKSKSLFLWSSGCRPAVRQPDGKGTGALLPSLLAPSPDLEVSGWSCARHLGWMELGAAAGLLHAWLMDLPRFHRQTCSCAGPKGGWPSPWSLLCQAGCAQRLFSLPTHIAKGPGAVEASLVPPGLWGTL